MAGLIGEGSLKTLVCVFNNVTFSEDKVTQFRHWRAPEVGQHSEAKTRQNCIDEPLRYLGVFSITTVPLVSCQHKYFHGWSIPRLRRHGSGERPLGVSKEPLAFPSCGEYVWPPNPLVARNTPWMLRGAACCTLWQCGRSPMRFSLPVR
jgi:hypothetical protein